MKVLSRNCISVYYALVASETDTTDAYGNLTGSPKLTYQDAVRTRMVLGARQGFISSTPHGLEENYSIQLMTDDMSCPITVGTIVWIGVTPLDGNGDPVPHTHVVTATIPTLNSITIRLAEVAR